MIKTGFETRVKVQQIIENQLPEFLRSESPKAVDFLKQYYISQEYQGGPADLADNLDQYLRIDNLTPEVITGSTTLSAGISSTSDTVQVSSTKGFPAQYGLFQIDSEVFTYTGITTNSFTGCVRGFSGITTYRSILNPEELVFVESNQASHTSGATVKNLSAQFLKEFYKKLKYTFTPGLEDVDFVSDLDVNNFIKESRSLYESKGTEESFKILFNVLYGVTPKVVDLENYLTKPSSAEYLRREIVVAERISGDPSKLIGQTIKKSSDSTTQGSVSEVEIFTRAGISTYYKLGLFVGYDDKDLIEGNFTIQPKASVINQVSVGASVITVDSTIGFPDSGTLISGDNTITYTGKTVNQFLGCSGVDTAIAVKGDVRTDEVFFGYENGDLTKKVEIRLTGVLSDFQQITDIKLSTEGQKIYVKNVGEKITNPDVDKTYKQLFANSWIYNTSSRYFVDNISGSNFTLKSDIDKSSLRVGDTVDILVGSTETVSHTGATVASISGKQITLNNLIGFTADSSLDYSIRRNLKTATSSGTPILYGNNLLTSDVQNVYNENDQYFYVASNSLPSYNITQTIKKAVLTSASGSALQQYNVDTEKYSIISFDSSVPFITGDEVYYTPETTALSGLPEGSYYVKVLSPNNKIKLYLSRSLIVSDIPIEFSSLSSTGSHTFTLVSQKDDEIKPQKILKKFPHQKNIKIGNKTETIPGSVGMLVNGVEITNYKSLDKVYYGPIESIALYNKGKEYDVVNPPTVEVSSGAGTTALVRPTLRGTLEEIVVDPQNFDLKRVVSATISGGNGSGTILEPVLDVRYREVEFDARISTSGGGVDIVNDTISFTTPHNFTNGTPLVYNRNGNTAVGVGTFGGSNAYTGSDLNSGSVYYVQSVNSTTVKLYPTLGDYTSGINTVGFTTSTAQGIHKFRTFESKKTLKNIKVIHPGSNYENKRLIVKPSAVSVIDDNIKFSNHGFSDGDIVRYSTDGTVISGLSTASSYYILKEDDNTFRLANAGVGATIKTNYDSRNYVNLTSVGSGYQNFYYPEVQITINAEFDGASGIITATPIIRGEISNLYLYEEGSGYGSDVLNFHKKPKITFKTGKDAEIKPIISGGKIVSIQISNSGSEYTSAPKLSVVGSGIGAKLRASISNGKISEVIIVNPGSGYDSNTTVVVVSNGINAYAEATVRSLDVNVYNRFGSETLLDNPKNNQGLEYGVVGYTTHIGASFSDDGTQHSPIIGWAYDGNPIYGPYAYTDPEDENSAIKLLKSGYVLSTSDVTDRPSSFSSGFFINDYKYNDSGDLDQYNGRYCRTPEFPNGIYAYFATVSSVTLESSFPYFVGNTYRSLPVTQEVDQNFDFNNSNLVRNTFPYKVSDRYADNDFISESNEILIQSASIDSVTKGSVSALSINKAGSGYAVGDVASFDNEGTNGGGLSADVRSLTGKTITNLQTSVTTYNSANIVWENDNEVSLHIDKINEILNGDNVVISGLSTYVKGLNKSYVVGVRTERVSLIKEVPSNATAGVVTDIYLTDIPSILSVGSSIGIGTERLSVLNIFPQNKVVRAIRGLAGSAHTASTEVVAFDGKLTISLNTPYFESKLDDKVYFNPTNSVGIGTTTGATISSNYAIGDVTKTISIPTQSIYLPNHPFKTSQQVVLERVNGSNAISVSNTESSGTFNIPSGTDTQTLFVINKSKDYIGLTTQVGFTTNTGGLYFRSFTSNADDTDYKYSIESNYTQVTGKVEKIISTVSVSTSHLLNVGDRVTLTVNPEQSVGVGTSTSVTVKYNTTSQKLIIDPIGFTSSSVVSETSKLNLSNHGLKTGDKVFYDSSSTLISGLSTGSYFVYKHDDNNISLTNTLYDANSFPPSIVSFGSTGGTGQELSLINPQIEVVRDNDLVFNVSDSSLSGYSLKIFRDSNFNNEIVSTGSTTVFNVVGFGTVGVSTNATLTLKHSSDLPSKLYYALEKSGYISTSDTTVRNSSEILYIDSSYNGSYSVISAASTTFNVSLKSSPESLSYTQDNTSVLKYSTTSLNARGGVDSMRITSQGFNYKKLPKFISIASTIGEDADIIPQSSDIGRIKEVTINDQGFDFSADRTLNPEVYISPIVNVVDRNTIDSINIVSGGSNYTAAPDLVVVNPDTGTVYTNGVLEAVVLGSSISDVNIIEVPKGLSDTTNKIYSVNNTNGIGINSCFTSSSGIVTCVLTTPIAGFPANNFLVGDKIFVEGIKKFGTSGDGHNSTDHKYQLFSVTAYRNTNPAELEYDLSGITTNPGIAVTDQNSYATVIKEDDYPVIEVTQSPLNFIIGEKLLVLDGSVYVEKDLIVTENLSDSIKVYGTYDLSEDDVLLGMDSGTLATVDTIENNRATFKVDYSLRKDFNWSNDIGKLNEDYQVTPDNDYYQNLSYTVKSPLEYEKIVNPVNRLLHSTGLKNFADTEISKTINVNPGVTTSASSLALIDIIGEERVDTIRNFDLALDFDTVDDKSKYLKLQNKKLSNYIKCLSNRVLTVDNVRDQFSSNQGDNQLFSEIVNYSIDDGYTKFIVQVLDPNGTERQATEVITIPTSSGDIVTFQKGNLYNTSSEIGEIVGNVSDDGDLTLRFIPEDQFDTDYDIKILKNNFSSNAAGVGTQSVGFVNLTGSNVSVGSGSTATVFTSTVSSTEALFLNIEVKNTATKDTNYVELYVDQDGTNTFVSEYYIDDQSNDTSTNLIGSFDADITSGSLVVKYTNDESDSVFLRSKVVGFGTTAVGIGTYRFKSTGQPDGSERTARLQSNFTNAVGVSTVFSVSKSDVTTIKSIAKVGFGNTTALHQFLVIHDDTDSYVTQYPFLTNGSQTGIGTFGSEISGSNLLVKFYPDASVTDEIQIQTYSELVQTERDLVNTPLNLIYGTISESVSISAYNAINGSRINKTNFDLNHNGNPIFEKTFDPTDTSVLTPGTGVFTVQDHYFSTGEKLIYAFGSSFDGVSSSTIESGGSGISTEVYAIRINDDQFKLATTRANAIAGTAITFSSVGTGNAHTLEMDKKMEKSIVTVDGVVQSPIAFTPVSHNLAFNGGTVSAASTFFTLSGISSILPGDILKIENEYVRVDSVGLGTTTIGPITGIGTFNLIESTRGFVGSSATSHTDGVEARVYLGGFNIAGNQIHFTEAPLGNNVSTVDSGNLPFARSSFNARVYLRDDYSGNKIFDNISKSFTGIGQTYRLNVGGANTTGIETGSGILFINDIFQTPTTDNNVGNNYSFAESGGGSNVIFTGVTTTGGILKSTYDVNQNQLPRGGVIVSLGSTPGLGYAPLVGASVTAVVGAGGSIVSIGLGSTDIVGSGYNGIVSIGVTVFESGHVGDVASITATVGAGGTLSFAVGAGGTGYTNPSILVSEPSYENLEVVGVSRVGFGATTDTGSNLLVSLEVGAASTSVGIGSTLFEVKSFKISRPGYGFRNGDVVTVVGLVTDRNLSSPVSQFELTVLDTFSDSFSAWQFGELDFIDPIDSLQNGVKTRFPLYYNGELLSFEIDENDSRSSKIDLNSVLLIFINGVIQEPGSSYRFEGGTSITFTEAPDEGDNIDIFFYRGTRGTDSLNVDVNELVKSGDTLRVRKNNSIDDTVSQTSRLVYSINSSDLVETNIYSGLGIDENNYKPVDWSKQKRDVRISGDDVYKSRDSIESQVYPTAKIIGDLSSSDTEIFVDDAQFFNYEENESSIVIADVDALIVTGGDPVAAAITAVVSAAGTISSLSIVSGGSGYVGASTSISIAAPKSIGVGVGTTATATASITSGIITSLTITNPGLGYTTSNPPTVLAPTANVTYENILSIDTVQGSSGIITGITTVAGIGTDLALKFFLNASSFTGLSTGYPIYIFNTPIGSGVTSIDSHDTSVVGVGTTFLDNVYVVNGLNTPGGSNADITVNILSSTDVTGLAITGFTTSPVGRFSWGRLSGFTRSSSPISIGVTGLTVDSGLTTFPTIQRRGYGLRDTGGLRKDLG